MEPSERVTLLRRAYRTFNERRVEALLAMMTEDVEWPDVAKAGILHGKEAVRRYWESQFAVVDSRVIPTDFIGSGDDLVAVVDQRILDIQGQTLASPSIVFHRYTFAGNLVSRMVVFTDRETAVTDA